MDGDPPAVWLCGFLSGLQLLLLILMALKHSKLLKGALAGPELGTRRQLYVVLLMHVYVLPLVFVVCQALAWVGLSRGWWVVWLLQLGPLALPLSFFALLWGTTDDRIPPPSDAHTHQDFDAAGLPVGPPVTELSPQRTLPAPDAPAQPSSDGSTLPPRVSRSGRLMTPTPSAPLPQSPRAAAYDWSPPRALSPSRGAVSACTAPYGGHHSAPPSPSGGRAASGARSVFIVDPSEGACCSEAMEAMRRPSASVAPPGGSRSGSFPPPPPDSLRLG
eukprot:TRINITY_DN36957_c0_g1_i1.p1 TRINITY_DN36957_c0_g1~~TRINITY_DN36957_c0_g1_i1.p1  ORF type:complete len:287 (+),score=105.44 TRINITY_DN36957_c0_g1_i1:37-861(+)